MIRSMSKEGKQKMLSPKAFAEKHDVAYTTVMFWLKNELIGGVEKEPLPFGKDRFVYQIPADAQKPTLKPGPKKADEATPTAPAVTAAEMKAGDVVKTATKAKSTKKRAAKSKQA